MDREKWLMLNAITLRDVGTVFHLLKNGFSVNALLKGKGTPLYWASLHGYPDIVRLLLNAGANVNLQNWQGDAPLHLAAGLGHRMVVEQLIGGGADVNQVGYEDGSTALLLAAEMGHTEVCKLLIASGSSVNTKNNEGHTPLYMSSQNGHIGVLRLLLSSGADVNVALNIWVTPLWIACQEGHTGIVQLMLSSGADVHASRDDKASALWIASQEGHLDIIRLLLDAGAGVNPIQTTTRATPLYVTSLKGFTAVVKLLLTHGADVNHSQYEGATPLCAASQNGHFDVVQALLSAGANPHLHCTGRTPLFYASKLGHSDIVRILLLYGAGLRPSYYSPLHACCIKGQLDIVRGLCGSGRQMNALSYDLGTTALHAACDGGQHHVVQYLLAHKGLVGGNSRTTNMSALQAYSLSLCRPGSADNETLSIFFNNFRMLLQMYNFEACVWELSDHGTSVLDALIMSRSCPNHNIDTLIVTLACIMAKTCSLRKLWYAIMPETDATRGCLRENQSLHTTFSVLVCTLPFKAVKTMVKHIVEEYRPGEFFHLCNCLLCQNILHVIALFTDPTDPDTVAKARLFLSLGVDVWAKDINGRLPAHIAYMQGNTQLAHCYQDAMAMSHVESNPTQHDSEVIYCLRCHNEHKTNQHAHIISNQWSIAGNMHDNICKSPKDYEKQSQSDNPPNMAVPVYIAGITECFHENQTISQLQSLRFGDVPDGDMKQLLYSYPNGKVKITGENEQIFASVSRLIQMICLCIGKLDPNFECIPELSGSMSEKTKMGYMDEMDFCLTLQNVHNIACMQLHNTNTGVVKNGLFAKCTPPSKASVPGQYWRMGPSDKPYFQSTLYCSHFWHLFLKSLTLPSISHYLKTNRITINDCKRKLGFVGTMSITWYGEIHPCLPISVDLVPVVKLADYNCLIHPRQFEDATAQESFNSGMNLSSIRIEKAFMRSLCETLRDAYCLCKVVRGLPKSFISKSGQVLPSDKVITSYYMKCALMWIIDPRHQFRKYYVTIDRDSMLAEIGMAATLLHLPNEASTSTQPDIHDVRMWAVAIFTMLKHIMQSGQPMFTYFLPHLEIQVKDKELTAALCDKCAQIVQP